MSVKDHLLLLSVYTFKEECDTEAENKSDHLDDHDDDDLVEAYADEPLADEELPAECSKRQNNTKRQIEELTRRMDGTESTNLWCKCRNCKIEFLENPKECCSCTEIPKCSTVLSGKKVLYCTVLEVIGQQPLCITQHPGFGAVCINM